MSVTKEAFGFTPDGRELSLYTMENSKGTAVKVSDLGASLVSIIFQDKNEKMRDIILGYEDAEGYYQGSCYFGAVIGRSGNRIDKGRFSIDGKTYQLAINDNDNNLHSGPNGFDKRPFSAKSFCDNSISFSIEDKDLEQGYPGNFKAVVTYTLTEDNELFLDYEAESDQDTVCNLTNHVYFNLSGHDSGSIEDTELWLSAKMYTPVRDYQAIPTGEYRSVTGTAFDFTSPKAIGRDIEADDEQLRFVLGYDHNFVLRKEKGSVVKFAEAYSPRTGILMECFTDLPGVQFYAGNCISKNEKGKDGAIYNPRSGFCLETQFYPNAINQEGFAKPYLKAGEKFTSRTCYKFSGR